MLRGLEHEDETGRSVPPLTFLHWTRETDEGEAERGGKTSG